MKTTTQKLISVIKIKKQTHQISCFLSQTSRKEGMATQERPREKLQALQQRNHGDTKK